MRPIERAIPGEPSGFGASTFNSLAAAASQSRPMGARQLPGTRRFLPILAQNTTANHIPAGGIVGLEPSELLVDFLDNDNFAEAATFVGVAPRLLSYSDPTNTADHRLHWGVALEPIEPNTVGPICLAGRCYAFVKQLNTAHRFVSIADDETDFAETRSYGLARLLQIAPGDPDDARPALIHIDPSAALRVEGYLESLNSATAQSSSLATTRAKLRLREVRNGQWERLDEYVWARNPDEWLTVPQNTYARAITWDADGWRLDYVACNSSAAAAASTSYT